MLYRPPGSQEAKAAAATTSAAGSRTEHSSSSSDAQQRQQQPAASSGASVQHGCGDSCACEHGSTTQQHSQQPASRGDTARPGCGDSCACNHGSSTEQQTQQQLQQRQQQIAVGAAGAAGNPAGRTQRPLEDGSPLRSSLSDEPPSSAAGGLVAEASGISVRSDGSVFPLARVEASQDLAGAAGAGRGDAGGVQPPKQPVGGGLGEAVLLVALLIGLLGMLLSGVLSLLSKS